MVFINSTILLILLVWAVAWFAVAVYTKRNDIADVAWSVGFILVAWSAYSLSAKTTVALIINILVTVWGLRLAWHIGRRFVRHGEDARYAQWRQPWKYFYIRSFFQVFLLQTGLLYLVALPLIHINILAHVSLTPLVIIGTVLWIGGFLFEIFADAQLRAFLAVVENRGKIMDKGLWHYSRHPNYFGEIMLWCGASFSLSRVRLLEFLRLLVH